MRDYNKQEIYNIVYYLLDNGYLWHMQYANTVLIPSEVQKIMKEREKFNKSILERIDKLLGKEEPNPIKYIEIYIQACVVNLNNEHYTNEQLNTVFNQLEEGKNVYVESEYKTTCIKDYTGYQITYINDYEKHMSKQNEKDINLE
ncbi:hypothetical protein [Staphylococcus phage vB_SsapH-Golestan101-M]|nr:hypothetical protein [Staphylococcus phage vB_SsapH-Golestan101-M]